jgi:Fic-DOC domain mobile mystery protein B
MKIDFEYPKGATPIDDISGLKISWVQTQADLNRVEAEAIVLSIEKYLLKPVSSPLNWFNLPFLKQTHLEMFKNIWDWAGKVRNSQTIPGIHPSQIQSALQDLCNNVAYWNTNGCEMTFLEQAARIHHRLVFIHPFLNGNGRFSRLISDRYLKAWKCPFPIWPPEIQNQNPLRNQYIASLQAADLGAYDLLIDFMKIHGGKDPSLNELLGNSFFKKHLQNNHLIKAVKAYLKHGYNVNETTNGHHPLQLSTKQGLVEIVKILINSGADILNRDKSGYTPFELAITHNQLNVAKILYDHGYPYTPRIPPTSKLLNYYSQLYEFDRQYF